MQIPRDSGGLSLYSVLANKQSLLTLFRVYTPTVTSRRGQRWWSSAWFFWGTQEEVSKKNVTVQPFCFGTSWSLYLCSLSISLQSPSSEFTLALSTLCEEDRNLRRGLGNDNLKQFLKSDHLSFCVAYSECAQSHVYACVVICILYKSQWNEVKWIMPLCLWVIYPCRNYGVIMLIFLYY